MRSTGGAHKQITPTFCFLKCYFRRGSSQSARTTERALTGSRPLSLSLPPSFTLPLSLSRSLFLRLFNSQLSTLNHQSSTLNHRSSQSAHTTERASTRSRPTSKRPCPSVQPHQPCQPDQILNFWPGICPRVASESIYPTLALYQFVQIPNCESQSV